MSTTQNLSAILEGCQQSLKKIAHLNSSIQQIEELDPESLSTWSLKETRYRLVADLDDLFKEVKHIAKLEMQEANKLMLDTAVA